MRYLDQHIPSPQPEKCGLERGAYGVLEKAKNTIWEKNAGFVSPGGCSGYFFEGGTEGWDGIRAHKRISVARICILQE